jgi:putative endonuclease
MFTVYVLYSSTHHKTYTGFSSDVDNRLLSHNEKATKGYTIKYRPWAMVHTEEFQTKAEAIKREKQLKTGNGRKFIWNIIENNFGSSDG